MIEGWNPIGGEAFAAPFSEDTDFIAFDGTRLQGHSEIASFHEALFKTHLRGGRVSSEASIAEVQYAVW